MLLISALEKPWPFTDCWKAFQPKPPELAAEEGPGER